MRSLHLLMQGRRRHGPSALFEGRPGRATRCRSGASACASAAWMVFEAVTGPLRLTSVLSERLGARKWERVVCVSEAERGGAAGECQGSDGSRPQRVSTDGRVDGRFGRPRRAGSPSRSAHSICRTPVRGEGARPVARRMAADRRARTVRAPRPRRRRNRRHPASGRVGTSVLLAGLQDDVLQWLIAADVVVAPSRRRASSRHARGDRRRPYRGRNGRGQDEGVDQKVERLRRPPGIRRRSSRRSSPD